MEDLEPSGTVLVGRKMVQPLWKMVWESLEKLKRALPSDPSGFSIKQLITNPINVPTAVILLIILKLKRQHGWIGHMVKAVVP